MRGGQILLEKVNAEPGDRRYRIRIQAYIDTESTVPFGGSTSDVLAIYGRTHQAFTIQVPEITMNSADGKQIFQVIDAARHVAFVEFTYNYTFPGDDIYTVSYTEINRNAGILNFDRSVDTPFYVQTKIMIDSHVDASSGTPINLEAPIFYGITGEPFTCSLGAYSSEGGSLSYRLVTPKSGLLTIVNNYSKPTSMEINPLSGLITWDGNFKGMATPGEYGFAVEITTMRDGFIINRTVRDFQIILEDNAISNITMSTSVTLGEYDQVYLPQEKSIRVFFEYSDEPNYTIEVNRSSEIDEQFAFETYDSTAPGKNIKVALIQVDPAALTDREIPYLINFRAKLSRNAVINEHDFSILVLTQDIELSVPDAPAGDVDREENSIKAFPNPVHDYLNFEGALLQTSAVSIFSSDGKEHILPLEKSTGRIDFGPAPSGTYFVKVKTRSKNQTIKIQKD